MLAARSRCPSCVGNPKALSLDPFQTSVRILWAKPSRVPLAADPLLHLLVLFVFRFSQCREQFVVAVDAAAILWRARVASGQTGRMFECGVGRQDLFDEDLVLPTVAEVVFVDELLLRERREVRHGVRAQGQPIPWFVFWWAASGRPNA